jgi:hypothetical protein
MDCFRPSWEQEGLAPPYHVQSGLHTAHRFRTVLKSAETPKRFG